jgi:hypothetical protein
MSFTVGCFFTLDETIDLKYYFGKQLTPRAKEQITGRVEGVPMVAQSLSI